MEARGLPHIVLGAALILGVSGPARAADTGLAEALFQEGKRLFAQKEYAKACPKLAESYRLDPGGGTLLTLALCHEGEGKLASAWAEFTDAETIAKRDNRNDRARIARKHAAALAPKLLTVNLAVAEADGAIEGFELKRDGVAIGKAAWTIPIPIDPGTHTFSAEAPGRKAWSTTVTIRPEDKQTKLEVPALEEDHTAKASAAAPVPAPPPGPAPAAAPVASTPDTPPASEKKRSYAAPIVLYSVAAVGFGAGAFFGLSALSAKNDANKVCPDTKCTDSKAVDDSKKAGTMANLANVGFGVGIVAAGVATVLLVAGGGGSSKAGVRVVPHVARDGGGLALDARW